MFVCCECGEVFENIARWTEDRGECFGFPTSEDFMGSPCCHGNYTEALQCNGCGEYITGTYIKTVDNKRYCSECYQEHDLGDED